MNFLSLVNFVIQESANEINELTPATWDSPEAGRRLYPRLKRIVAQAWEEIQLERNQWEFAQGVATETITPGLSFENGYSPSDDITGETFTSTDPDSDFTFTVNNYMLNRGSLFDADAQGSLYFTTFSGETPSIGELFTSTTSQLLYMGPPVYRLSYTADRYELDKRSFMVVKDKYQTPLVQVPWHDHRFLDHAPYSNHSTAPHYFAEDPLGNIAFYHGFREPFLLQFHYATKPQTLTEWEDTPIGLPEAYHKWIGWRALMKLADFDKNPSLFSHARKGALLYKNRAEANLMPRVGWRFPEL